MSNNIINKEFTPISRLNSFDEFIPLAMRTESIISEITTNRPLLEHTLNQFVQTAEKLDGFKKQIFYCKKTKLEDLFNATISTNDKIDVNSRLFHAMIGVVTEAGEVAQILLKAIKTGELDKVNLAEEMFGDTGWYQGIAADEAGIDFYQALTNVINKLRVRYPDKYSDLNADNRNLEAERKQLENGVQ